MHKYGTDKRWQRKTWATRDLRDQKRKPQNNSSIAYLSRNVQLLQLGRIRIREHPNVTRKPNLVKRSKITKSNNSPKETNWFQEINEERRTAWSRTWLPQKPSEHGGKGANEIDEREPKFEGKQVTLGKMRSDCLWIPRTEGRDECPRTRNERGGETGRREKDDDRQTAQVSN